MITRRDALAPLALAPLAFAMPGFAKPAFAHHAGETHAGEEMILGDPAAPVTIIEYSSLTCPHCANFHVNTLPRIKERYIDTGEARLLYRDFPFDRAALLAAAIARCAGRERFFVFLDVLFRTQDTWARDPDPAKALTKVGRLGGLPREAIESCFADQALLDGILASRLTGAQEFDVKSTPTFIINGEKLVGAQPFDRFAEVIERMLAKS